ncbi:hypothetical protein AG1IA_02995 [Rhizoctonia solani AG-1 IA]|uniref:Uncharacterized protein n=1 Tax=Thanatephorus cucumeris (strain AG1-IA) TaxID=983506 RepID=L8X1T6_THACA|nr:hypothetical protein AG1IA_02995 [Rhizoctonia solani AG-1 IA]
MVQMNHSGRKIHMGYLPEVLGSQSRELLRRHSTSTASNDVPGARQVYGFAFSNASRVLLITTQSLCSRLPATPSPSMRTVAFFSAPAPGSLTRTASRTGILHALRTSIRILTCAYISICGDQTGA